LEEDLRPTPRGSAYGSSASAQAGSPGPGQASHAVTGQDDKPDFTSMSPEEKLAWNRARLDRTLGKYR
jgi:hypothetical protein